MATSRDLFAKITRALDVSQPYARYSAALIAGVAITFSADHSTYVGLVWLTFVVVISLITRGGPATAMNAVAWWATLVVAALALLGLIASRMSPATALSLTIALVAFETSRAFTRGDRVWLWSTGVLALSLSILYFTVDANDRTATGLTGGWAIIAGIFGLISVIDSRAKSRRLTQQSKSSKSTTTAKAKTRGAKR